MKKVIFVFSALIFSFSMSFSQELESGRNPGAKPGAIVAEPAVKTSAEPISGQSPESDQDKKETPVLKSATSVADQLINDDLIVNGNLGVGIDMANDYSFGFNTFVLRENNLRIFFDDTSTDAFPANKWILEANGTSNGGSNHFAIQDATAGRNLFLVEAGAPANSLYVNKSGRIGIGTSSPLFQLHLLRGDTPGLRLEQDASYGWTAQSWDMAGNESNFFIRDVTNGSRLSFRIQPGTPTNTLCLRQEGFIGIGTWIPQKPVHIERTGSPAALRLQRTDGQVWDLVSDTSFSVRSISDDIPFEIAATAPSNSLFVDSLGWIGVGKHAPEAKLDVKGSIKLDSVIQFTLLDTTGIAATAGTLVMNSQDSTLNLFDGSEWIALSGNQNMKLTGTQLALTGSDSVADLSPFLDNTDDQILNFSENTLSIENGNSVDLSPFLDNTDNQNLNLSGNTLSIEGGNSVDLSGFTNTDNQSISIVGNTLSIEGGNSVDLSGFTNTDNQSISIAGNTLRISGSSSDVSLKKYLDNTDEQQIYLEGNILKITGSSSSVDLSGLVTDTDEQNLSLAGHEISISNGNSIDLSGLFQQKQQQIDTLTAQVEEMKQTIAELKELVAKLVGTGEISAVTKSSSINQNIPNPFSTTTVIPFQIDSGVKNASIAFYTEQGQLVETVKILERGKGTYTFVNSKSAKIYLYTLITDGVKVDTKKMLVSQ